MKLFYFTDSYPYGLGEMWKSNELKILINYFENITIVPFSFGGNFDHPKTVHPKILVEHPLFENPQVSLNIKSVLSLLSRNIFYYLSEFLKKKVFLKKQHLITWLVTSIRIEMIRKTKFINELSKIEANSTILYFYWGKGACDVVPIIKNKKFSKIVVRMHRYDLFEDENNNYIPYRKQLLKSISLAAPSSQAGKDHLLIRYPKLKFNVEVLRCGTTSEGIANASSDNILRIITCSYIVPVKRLSIIANAILNIPFQIQWTHLGDGPLKEQIEAIVKNRPENVNVKFEGMIPSTDVVKYYLNNPVDLFINVSSSEGVPFSIMEALSAGIPVFATNVGGTGEIIDDKVGKILPKNLTPEFLSEQLYEYYNLPKGMKDKLRKNAFNRYETSCNANVLAEELAKTLIE